MGRICAGGAGAVRAGCAGAGRSEIEISRSEEKEVREVGDAGSEVGEVFWGGLGGEREGRRRWVGERKGVFVGIGVCVVELWVLGRLVVKSGGFGCWKGLVEVLVVVVCRKGKDAWGRGIAAEDNK